MQPIWKDYIVNLGTADDYQFRILNGTTPIYEGRAYKKPNESAVYVRINDICADHLPTTIPTFTSGATTTIVLPTFKVQVKSGSSWVDKDTQVFTPDWSYESGRTLTIVNAPILLGAGMLTSSMTSSGTMTIRYYAPSGIALCCEWALHYKNAFGGWNSLPLEGLTSREDQITRKTYDAEYNNGTSSNRGKVNTRNDVSRRFTFHTGWMSDDESSRMHHLLNSPQVYLHRIHTGEVYPLVLTNSSTPYKTFKNQGRKMVDYTIEAEVAQSFTRK